MMYLDVDLFFFFSDRNMVCFLNVMSSFLSVQKNSQSLSLNIYLSNILSLSIFLLSPSRNIIERVLDHLPCPSSFTYAPSLFFFVFISLFICGCVGSSLLCAGFLQLRRVEATLRCGAGTSHCGGFSCCGAWALGAQASVVAACGLSSCGSRALEHRRSSCGTQAQLLCGLWDLPGPGLKPVSPALAGGFLTTEPPGKALHMLHLLIFLCCPLGNSLRSIFQFMNSLSNSVQTTILLISEVLFCLFKFNDFIFISKNPIWFFFFFNFPSQSNFRFTAKLSRWYRDFLYTPCPTYAQPPHHQHFQIRVSNQSGSFVTIDEPTLTHQHHPQSMFTLKFIVHCMDLDKYIMKYIHHYGIIQSSISII